MHTVAGKWGLGGGEQWRLLGEARSGGGLDLLMAGGAPAGWSSTDSDCQPVKACEDDDSHCNREDTIPIDRWKRIWKDTLQGLDHSRSKFAGPVVASFAAGNLGPRRVLRSTCGKGGGIRLFRFACARLIWSRQLCFNVLCRFRDCLAFLALLQRGTSVQCETCDQDNQYCGGDGWMESFLLHRNYILNVSQCSFSTAKKSSPG